MTSTKTLVQGVLALGFALSAAACASTPEASAPMALGAQAVAPHGFVSFCERQPGDCGASPAELTAMRLASAQATSPPVAAITFDWSRVFSAPRAGQTAAVNASAIATAQTNPLTFDWNTAFAEAEAKRPAAAPPASERTNVQLSTAAWTLLVRTNDRINRALAERSDQQVYGVSEYWATPLESGLTEGDCEDYVLEKRRALLAAGVPAQALSIAVVTTPRGDTHAVLLVATDRGEYVLDNLTAWILPWTKTPYQWRERQVAGSASHWAMAALPAPAPSDLLLASAR